MGYKWPEWEIVPGFLSVNAGIQAGEVCIKGTRIPTYATWVWNYLNIPEAKEDVGITREQIIASYAFEQGVRWQRGRKRRKEWDAVVHKAWEDWYRTASSTEDSKGG